MKQYTMTVNGVSYDVTVEEIGGAPVIPVAAPVVSAPAVASAPKVAPAAAPAGGAPVKAPMPGNVLDIKVSNGQAVKKGDVLVILEAMKMENEISAPQDGTVTVVASKGATVNTGDVLVTLS